MSKCGKGCMPECEYFTTGGCISPFNCQYKIETGYINSATSIPTYMEKQMSMTAEEIEHCLERFTMGKTTDVMNFDYAGTLAYIQRLKAENAALRERLKKAVELPFIVIDKMTGKEADEYEIALHEKWANDLVYCDMEGFAIEQDGTLILLDECGQFVYCSSDRFEVVPKSRLAELKGEKKNG